MDKDVQTEVEGLLKLGANKKLVKASVQEKTGKVVLLKDLSNVATAMRNPVRNDLDSTIQLLRNYYCTSRARSFFVLTFFKRNGRVVTFALLNFTCLSGTDCHILTDNDEFRGLLICTDSMKASMRFYPEYIGIDATYKLLELRTPVYVIHNEDGNGATKVVCIALLVQEDVSSMQWFLKKFQELNPGWTQTKCIMADKDLLERQCLKEYFPQAKVLVCVYHTLRTFGREVSAKKLGITAEDRQTSLKLLQKMVLSKSDNEFEKHEKEFDQEVHPSIKAYYDKNWRPVRHEWYTGPQFVESSFNNTTNNRLENFNGQLKSVMKSNNSLEEFFRQLFKLLGTLADEHDHGAAYSMLKRPCNLYSLDSGIQRYQKHLTPYAYERIVKEYHQMGNVELPAADNGAYNYNSSSGVIVVSCTDCTCSSRISMMLPCRHMLAARIQGRLRPLPRRPVRQKMD
ncbi:hypothetical protein HPB48_022114 [Haemaphysalis longicornis]|uniref:SWIM-type domain-containing protein n=1 Tax=Haemaphysalis longicornis TaxID=44386 RepID=A0A9J6GYJ9_HAELO|nr:hypothetical protein HPB48_022114 [Haemaphysalis longicornis]